ncbi:PEGA domain-containing protein [Myxococcota bacterium]|nr:PEGA domain-containing protein [Myxococcota bacterium]MBU1430680.1 PEGA domain-containing protein [Myxococcota bacterium]MBU1899478.1 PEGA domain-containing protein [Myxococcota bacterium]
MRAPDKFGDYYLIERIAVGGMAEVFKGVSYGVEGFERLFAVKRVLPDISEDQEFIEMFIDEAKIAVQLTHPNIGQIFELGNAAGAYFIAMEFVQGKDIRTLFDRARRTRTPLDIPMCCHIIKEVCEALGYAHSKLNDRGEPLDLIHRDVSPQNVLISYEGEVKLIDFGIAKAAGRINKTQDGILKGKFGYMSPEQVRGRPIDHRSDLFALAVLLYELLTLERCFQGESDFSTLEKIKTVDIRRPASLNRNIPPELERIVLRGLSRNPDERYQTASDFQDALQKFLYQSGTFYARKDLAAFMKRTFGQDLREELTRLNEFREYARKNIAEARRAASSLDNDATVTEDVSQFRPDLATLNWGAEELETSVWDRSPSELINPAALNAARASLRSGPSPSLSPQRTPPHRPQGPQARATPPAFTGQPSPDFQQLDLTLPPPTPASSRSRLIALALVTMIMTLLAAAAVWLARNQAPLASLTLRSQPPVVTLYLNGEKMHEGRSPFTVQNVPPGEHRITVEAAEHQPLDQTLMIERGEQKTVVVELAPTVIRPGLSIDTVPASARVFIDDQLIDETPLETRDVPPGRHHLRIEKAGYLNWEGTVILERGQLQKLQTIHLTPDKVEITFNIEPAEAQVKLKLKDAQGQTRAISPGPVEVENTGHLIVLVEATGFQPLEAPIAQSKERRINMLLELEKAEPPSRGVKRGPYVRRKPKPKPAPVEEDAPPERVVKVVKPAGTGYLKLLSRPSAKAFIDGNEVGWTPLIKHALPAGTHTVKLIRSEPPAFEKTFSVQIEADKTHFRKVTP